MDVVKLVSRPKSDYAILVDGTMASLVRLRKRGVLPQRFSAGDKEVDSVLLKTRLKRGVVDDLIRRASVNYN